LPLCGGRVVLGLLFAVSIFGAHASAEAVCGVTTPGVTSGDVKVAVKIDGSSVWRPRDSEVKFSLSAAQGVRLTAATVATCFRWSGNGAPKNEWLLSPSLRVVDATDPSNVVYAARVPNLSASPQNLWRELTRSATGGETVAWGLVPLADFQVYVTGAGASAPIAITQQIGITNEALALAVALVVVAVGWSAVYLCGRMRGVPGSGDPILQVISTKAGYASLSQLQILLWSFVVGAGAIYVIVLSGNLIPLTGGTLVLLGISGGAALLSKLQSAQQSRSVAQGPLPPAPNATTPLMIRGEPESTAVSLAWGQPDGGGVDAYTIQYRAVLNPPANWTTVTTSLLTPGVTIAGLTPGQAYEFQVSGTNAAGAGSAQGTSATTAPPPAAVPAAVAWLNLGAFVGNRTADIGG
jgi:hypothetical protein